MSSPSARASASNRDLPVPVSPTSSIIAPEPRLASAIASRNSVELAVAANQRKLSPRDHLRSSSHRRSDIRSVYGLGLALDRKRLEQRLMEASLNLSQHVAGRVHVTDGRFAHDAGSEIDGVAHEDIPAPIRRSHLTGEHRSAVDADLHRSGQLRRDDLAQREQHALLVVSDHPGAPALRRILPPSDEISESRKHTS